MNAAGILRAVETRPAAFSEREVVWFVAPWTSAHNASLGTQVFDPSPKTKKDRRLARRERAAMSRIWSKHMRHA